MATTEQHKLPDTVVSRCECFVFKKPTHQVLVESILMVAKEEKYEIEKKSANLIATLADGSFRDAYSVLQKIIHSSADHKLSATEVEKVLGAPSATYILEILEAIKEQNAGKGIDAVRKASEENADMQVFLKMILRSLRFVLLLRFAPDMKKLVIDETGEEEFEKLSELANPSTDGAKNINSKTLLAFLEAYSRQVYATIPELPIELAIIESCGEGN
jgi:DNA polymerase-3 subunit gamma/tau